MWTKWDIYNSNSKIAVAELLPLAATNCDLSYDVLQPVFFSHRLKCFWNDRKKFSHFGQHVWKYRLMNTLI